MFFFLPQMAPKVVRDTVLSLVREGFLQQVMGPALLQVQLYQYKNFQQPAVYIPCMGTIVWAVGWAVNIVFIHCKLHICRVLPTLVGSGRLQPPLSNLYHHSGLIYHHSQWVKSAEMLFSAMWQYFN